MRRHRHLLAVVGAAALLASGASGALASPPAAHGRAHAPESARAAAPGAGTFPVSVRTRYGTVVVRKRPTRIVSLSPTVTEMLFAIGAGRQVVAVDNDSTYPKNAPRSGLSGYTPNVEAIARYRPDLVVISYDPTHPDLVEALRLLGIPTLFVPAAADLAQTYGEIATLGRVTGRTGAAQSEIASVRRRIAALVRTVPHRAHPLTYFYEIGSGPLYTATGDTFVGSVLALAGLRNVAGASVGGNDYPQFSSEVVVRDNPTFVFVADGATVAAVASRPGWSALGAVRAHRVVELDPDIASRWGPRVVDLLRAVIAAVDKVPAAAAG
ncbi:MAG TPA: ABC transporter substrate-binding protein [Acidimicrobiales bacterium]|nr:ABC transporter substrate-binding protein [Acidimicrobiales bacterium]